MKWLVLLSLFSCHQAFASECVTKAQIPHAKLEQCGSVGLLTLSGTAIERAHANGVMFRQHLSPMVMDYFSQKALDSVKNKAANFIAEIFYNQLVRVMHKNAPSHIREELDAMAVGAEVDPIYFRRALSLPDTAAIVNAAGVHSLFRGLPASGCTSVAKSDGKNFLFARNLDFAGAELWDKHPLIVISHPAPGTSELKYISIGSHGIHFAGITGVNEAGITFAVHQNYTKDASLEGIPMFFIGELVLRQAQSLEEAQEILKKYRPGPMWTFLLSNLNTQEVIAVEVSKKHFSVRKMEGQNFVQTNHLLNQDLRNEEEFISTGTKLNSAYRMEQAFERLENLKNEDINASSLAKILSQQADKEGYFSAYHDILKAHTIQTVIFESREDKTHLYLSAEEAPAAGGKYAKFLLSQLFSPQAGNRNYELVDLVEISAEKRAKQRQIAHAFRLFYDEEKFEEAAAVLAAHPTLDAALFRSVAYYRLGNYAQSLELAQNARSNPRFLSEPTYILQSLDWVKLTNLWKLDRFLEARALAKDICEYHPANPRLKELCNIVSKGKIPPSSLLNISFEFFTGDLSGRAH